MYLPDGYTLEQWERMTPDEINAARTAQFLAALHDAPPDAIYVHVSERLDSSAPPPAAHDPDAQERPVPRATDATRAQEPSSEKARKPRVKWELLPLGVPLTPVEAYSILGCSLNYLRDITKPGYKGAGGLPEYVQIVRPFPRIVQIVRRETARPSRRQRSNKPFVPSAKNYSGR